MKKILIAAHLDLKGVQYRHDYYEEYFRNLRAMGYVAVLVEYEDVFPFQSATVSSHPEEVWSMDFLRHFQKLAAKENIEIIPLQQCLGHLEYAFRQPENQRFSIPGSDLRDLHVAMPEARQWLKGLLEEMLRAHPESRYIHLGMDEARGFVKYAEAAGKDPLALFLSYLEELCAVCERHGKTPLIWSDMLEDHIAPENIAQLTALRGRVILVPWNYSAGIKPEALVRFSGLRCSRQWLEDSRNAPHNAGEVRSNLLYYEDWAPEIKALTADFHVSPWLMEPLFQAAVWKRLGFTVWGGAGASVTQDRSVLPYYHWREANIQQWKHAAECHQLDGLIMTQWMRSNSFSVPNLIPDVVWPVLSKAAGADNSTKAFFPEAEDVDDLVFKIGKCREGWSIESLLIEKMRAQKISVHAHEWKTILLMLQVLLIYKGITQSEELMACYAGIGRLNEIAWGNFTEDIADLRRQLLEIQMRVREHLEKRYYGHALEEWFYKVFTAPLETLDRLDAQIQKNHATH